MVSDKVADAFNNAVGVNEYDGSITGIDAGLEAAIAAHGKQHMPMGIAVVAGAYMIGVATVLVATVLVALWSNGVFA